MQVLHIHIARKDYGPEGVCKKQNITKKRIQRKQKKSGSKTRLCPLLKWIFETQNDALNCMKLPIYTMAKRKQNFNKQCIQM